jgi:hypothetical protein
VLLWCSLDSWFSDAAVVLYTNHYVIYNSEFVVLGGCDDL